MRLVVQRVKEASVTIDHKQHSYINQGLLVLLGIGTDDTEDDIRYLSQKLVQLRIFGDEQGLMNLSVKDINGEILVVSQFTLMAATRKGNRPSFIQAARPETAIPLYEQFCAATVALLDKPVATGIFGADMQVAMVNDGPVTIIIDSKQP
ncbi:D-tyrosyl-tRNA(Tyr) deacylase [compost metagenome]